MSTLQEILKRRKNPTSNIEERFVQLIMDMEEFRVEAKRAITKAIFDAKTEGIFKNLDPAKKIAEDTANRVITDFKKDTTIAIDNISESMDKRKNEVIAEMENSLKDRLNEFDSKIQNVIEDSKKSLEIFSESSNQEVTNLIRRGDDALGQIAKQIGPPGNKGDKGDEADTTKVVEKVLSKLPKTKETPKDKPEVAE